MKSEKAYCLSNLILLQYEGIAQNDMKTTEMY